MAIQLGRIPGLRGAGIWATRASLAVLLCQLCVGFAISKWRPEWTCNPIEAGGKELICGKGYGLPLLDVANRFALWTWIALYLLGIAAWYCGRLPRKDKVILLVLSCALALFGVAAVTIGAGDSP